MKRVKFYTLLFCMVSSLPAFAGLEISTTSGRIVEDRAGGTVIAADNSKGQAFVMKREGTLEGVSLKVAGLTKAAGLQIKVFVTSKGFPAGDPIFADSASLPSELKPGDVLQIRLSEKLKLEAGSYALVFESHDSDLRVQLAGSRDPDIRLIRRNKSTKNQWAPGNGKDICMAIDFLGDGVPSPAGGTNTPVVADELLKPVRLIRDVSRNVKPLCSRLPPKPNIVTCMVDDLGWNQISVPQSTMGTRKEEFKTPNLEKLASEGLSFTHAYAQPNCAPTRAAMLSGQYPARVHNQVYVVQHLNRFGLGGITREEAKFYGPEQSEDVATEAITVAEALRENGYATAHIGKYHVGGHKGDQTLPENVGFDINFGGCNQGNQPVCFASQDEERGKWVFKKLGRGDFDKYAEPYTDAYLKKHNFPASLEGMPKHISDAVGDAMEETIARLHATGKPFYLQLHPYAVHGPVRARPDLKAAAGGDEFAGFVASVDLIVGRLLKSVDDPNGDGDKSDSIAKNTLILFTSDNGGTHRDNHPLRGQKGMFTEGGVRVPLIACWPGVIPPDTVTDYMVHSVDYYPTYLELAGREWIPPESVHPLDGESFADILRKPDIERKRGPLFYLFPGYMDKRAQPCVVAVDEQNGKRYKLLYFYEADAWQLYNLTDDIGESRNLIGGKPELAASMAKKINAWLLKKEPTWQPRFPLVKETGSPAGPPPAL